MEEKLNFEHFNVQQKKNKNTVSLKHFKLL